MKLEGGGGIYDYRKIDIPLFQEYKMVYNTRDIKERNRNKTFRLYL